MRYVIERFLTILTIADALLLGSIALADDAVQQRPRALEDYQIVSSDRAARTSSPGRSRTDTTSSSASSRLCARHHRGPDHL